MGVRNREADGLYEDREQGWQKGWSGKGRRWWTEQILRV